MSKAAYTLPLRFCPVELRSSVFMRQRRLRGQGPEGMVLKNGGCLVALFTAPVKGSFLSEHDSIGAPAVRSVRFGAYELSPALRLLSRDGQAVSLGARAFDILVALVERHGRVVSKHELMTIVWPTTVVDEGSVRVAMSALRKELGPELIATVPGRGYQFTAQLQADESSASCGQISVTGPAGQRAATDETRRLLGRDALLEQIREAFGLGRLVTLTGHPGTGKTALARALRSGHAHGMGAQEAAPVYWIDLAALSSDQHLVAAIAQASDVAVTDHASAKALVAALRSSQALLILDNAEHMVDAVASMAHQLLEGCPQVHLLVTSQVRLKIAGELVVLVPPLEVAQTGMDHGQAQQWPAQALFLRHCRQFGRPLPITQQNLDLVSDICLRVDGVPLAIEYAAAAVPLLGLKGVADALDARRLAMSAGRRDAPDRQRTLRAALSWSVSLLGPYEQSVVRRMGVFLGSTSMQLLEPVVNIEGEDPWRVMEALSELIDRSLVVPEDDGIVTRYRLLESTRAFALEVLGSTRELSPMRQRHAQVMEAFFSRVRKAALDGTMRLDDGVRELQAELHNARPALQWAMDHDGLLALGLASSLAFVLRRSGGIWESGQYLAKTECFATEHVDHAISCGWVREAIIHWTYGNRAKAVHWLGLADPAYRAAANSVALIDLLVLKANCLDLARNNDDALAAVLDEIAAMDKSGLPDRLLTFCASGLVMAAHRLGRTQEVQTAERWAAVVPDGDAHGRMGLVTRLMSIQISSGRAAQAIALGQPLFDEHKNGQYRQALHWLPISLAAAYLSIGEPLMAAHMAKERLEVDVGNELLYAWTDVLAQLACLTNNHALAASLTAYGDRIYAAAGIQRPAVEANLRADSIQTALTALPPEQYQAACEAGGLWDVNAMQAAAEAVLLAIDPVRPLDDLKT
ncbi:ATP-binding protein [Roseateles amylovorans]|uniref:Helix-turn-helix transcriptional regulator n=1 Tax=Roseateles amylovorans TaxID=2978473 RepID=A0ABY6AYW8_9BURK|nr:helix-turn-helix transcriptional regulator [Roseateles amylovorans]UXH78371.1 helix-turn-helix transcriptional regulator [Roseateles amylovorans]